MSGIALLDMWTISSAAAVVTSVVEASMETTEDNKESENIFIKCCRYVILCPLGCCVLCANECSGGGLTNGDTIIKKIFRCLFPCCSSKNHPNDDQQ